LHGVFPFLRRHFFTFDIFFQSSSGERVEFTEQVLCTANSFKSLNPISAVQTAMDRFPTRPTHRIQPVNDAPPSIRASEYLLVCTATSFSINHGSWNFSLESVDGQSVLEAGDQDLGDLNRLTLLAAVRGLEAIDGPSGVTLLSHNRYLIRSLSDSLPRWRENNFVWEHFGRRIDVQHADLWRRVDRALSIHCVEACLVSSRRVSPAVARQSTIVQPADNHDLTWRIDSAHDNSAPAPKRASSPRPTDSLRRWLLDSATSHATRGGGRRYTAADLASA
jgi:ribonuclease HI